MVGRGRAQRTTPPLLRHIIRPAFGARRMMRSRRGGTPQP